MNEILNESQKSEIERAMAGLSMMTLFTTIWTLIAEYALNNRDYRLVGIFFFVLVLFFIIYYFKFQSFEKSFLMQPKVEEKPEDKARSKWFWIIFALEGVAILVAKNVLVNTGHNNLFVPCFALVVGLHFFPLGKIFKRNFDYYMGACTCIIAITGIVLTIMKNTPDYIVTALVAISCAIATSIYGLKMLWSGNRILSLKKVN